MLKLLPLEVCKLRDICFYSRGCKGLDTTRNNVFTCMYADELKEKEKPEQKPDEFPACSLKKPDFPSAGCG